MICKYYFMSIFIGMIILVYAIPSHAYTMADYWAFNEGNVWSYDRDLYVIGTETHSFGNYAGRQYIQAREFCDNHPYIYTGPEGVLAVGFYNFEDNQWVNISANPIKLADAEMNIGDSVFTNIPAGVIDDDPISFTISLEAIESVTVPAGTFNNALRLKVFIDDGFGTYTEKIWLARDVGPVQMHRVSETNNTPGCFFTCGSFRCDSDIVEERFIKLTSFIKGKNGTVTIFYVSHDGVCNSHEPCFSFIQDAIDAADSVTLIKVTEGTYEEDVVIDQPKKVTIRGGWNSTFTTRISATIIKSMRISDGTVRTEYQVIR